MFLDVRLFGFLRQPYCFYETPKDESVHGEFAPLFNDPTLSIDKFLKDREKRNGESQAAAPAHAQGGLEAVQDEGTAQVLQGCQRKGASARPAPCHCLLKEAQDFARVQVARALRASEKKCLFYLLLFVAAVNLIPLGTFGVH